MDFRHVTVIGVDCISTSIALGLKAQHEPPRIVGYDVDATAANLARSKGAFDRVERRPDRACRNADLVIVAMPLPAIRETFATIAPHLRPGCLVTDTAHLKAPVMRWAAELLPQNIVFVGGHPIPNPAIVGPQALQGLEAASGDLLRGGLYCITTPAGTPGPAIDTFAQLAQALEAHPFFIDVTEHDGLQAGVEGLPDLLAIALLRSTVDTPGWQEMRKFAGHRFAAATAAADGTYERATAAFLNREHILRRLNALLGELIRLRDLLTHDDAEAVEETFAETAEGRSRWVGEQEQGMWVTEQAVSTDHIPSAGERVSRMIFGEYMTDRLKGRPDQPREE
jgi:prephenate dehydrogenase